VALSLRVVHAVETGFSALFIWDGSSFINLVSVLKPPTAPWRTDVDIPTKVLEKCLADNGAVTGVWTDIDGEQWASKEGRE
jgi:hypothetical protein